MEQMPCTLPASWPWTLLLSGVFGFTGRGTQARSTFSSRGVDGLHAACELALHFIAVSAAFIVASVE